MKYTVTSAIPPRLHQGLDNKTYIVPQWIEVPNNTTIDQIEWIQPTFKTESKTLNDKTLILLWKPEMGENKYNTHFDERTNKFSCGCQGFWRAKGLCKHVKLLMSK